MTIDYTDPAVSPHLMVSAPAGHGKTAPYAALVTSQAADWRTRVEAAEAAIARVRELVEGHINVGAVEVLRALDGEPASTETGDEQE